MEVDELDYLLPANCPNPYFDTWDRHNSIAFSTATKGLRNAPGENNCFVNSAVQVFWHLDVFRRSYRRLSGHTCMGNSCIFCALKVIFTQFQYSDQRALHPEALRKALAETFVDQQRFQLGHMDDAAECFENILRRIHFHIANNCSEDSCTAPHCLPHQKFSLSIVEKVVCPCGASSNPLKFSEMVHYISAKALVSQARVMQETGDTLHPDRFGLLLRNANAMGDIRDCPGACGKTVQIRRTLLNSPDVVSIGLVWDSDHPTMETTTEVAKNIGTTILLQDVFHSVMQDLRTLPKLQLVGLVCYYGKHYSTFVFHSKLQVWIYFDDATVREIGPRWEHVVDKCSKGRYQPLLLLYANPNAVPVSVETAPLKKTMAAGYGNSGGYEEESSLDRTHESISSQHSYQRSRTPNPESSHQLLEQPLLPRARSVTPSTCELSRQDSGASSRSSGHSRQQSFIMAVGTKSETKAKHPLRLGGQAHSGAAVPGPMVPLSDQRDSRDPHSSSQSSSCENENYSDYTLSTSDQYRRPSLGGFEPSKLPLAPNVKGYTDPQRKESFKKGKESVRADFVRYQVDSPRSQETTLAADHFHSQVQGYQYPLSGYDLSKPPGLPPKAGASNFYQPQFRQRSISQGGDEAYSSDIDTSSCDSHPQHTVVKPTASSQNYDNVDGMSHSHTPVQSGLATLPRKKKEMINHPRQNSFSGQDGLTGGRHSSTGNPFPVQDQRATPNPSGLPPAIPGKQSSQMAPEKVESSSASEKKKAAETEKKAKKLRKEQKKAEKKKNKSDTSKSQPDLSTIGKPPLYPSTSVSSTGSNDNVTHPAEFREEKLIYIDRKVVESVLKQQGLRRQPSTHSTNSSSSIDSDSIMGRLLAGRHGEGHIQTDSSFDNVSLGSHKDSGYGSSDRNSSSSTGSGTIDPYTQYFISKSMVVPRNLNPQPPHQMVSDFTAPNPQMYTAIMGQSSSQTKNPSGMPKEEMSRHLHALSQRKVMHPIKESSQEDILKILPKENTPSTTPVRGTSPSPASEGMIKEGRPPPIPPKNFAAFQVSKSSHQREPSIDSLDKDEVKNDYFVSMCEKADELMDSCILYETQGDLTAAMRYCDSALGCLKEAMNQTDICNKASVYAQKKHNSCLLKSRSLFKRMGHGSSDGSTQGGKRSSITSTDSDNSDKPIRRVSSKEGLMSTARGAAKMGQPPVLNQNVHQQQESVSGAARKSPLPMSQAQGSTASQGRDGHNQQGAHPSLPLSSSQQYPPSSRSHVSRSCAAEQSDTASIHTRSSSNSSVRSSASVPCSMSQAPLQSMPRVQTNTENVSSSMAANTPVPLDAYGTLPRNRKARRTSDPTGNSEVYQMYLNKQKNLQSGNGSDSKESDSSSCDGNVQKKMNQAEIRELQENSVVQRQMQQFGNVNHLQKMRHEMPADSQLQKGDSRSQFGQRHSNGGGSVMMSQTQPAVYSTDRQSQNSQALHNSSSNSQSLQQQQRGVSCMPTVSSAGVQNLQHSHSSLQSDSGSFHHLLQQQRRPQSAQPMSQPASGQHSQLHSCQPQSRFSYSNQLDPSVQYPVHGPTAQPVSGYTQPLPGHRSVTPLSQQSSRTVTQSGDASGSSHLYVQGYPQYNKHNQSMLQSQNFSHDNQSQPNFSQTESSQGSNISGPHPSSVVQNRTAQNNSVQNLNQSVQNLSIKRRNSGGPPPAPPARTTSNPDFKQQMPASQFQHQQPSYCPLQQQQQAPNSEVGSCTQQKSIARIQPNSHLDLQSGAASTNLQRSVAPDPPASHRHPASQSLGSEQPYGTQLKHAVSSTGLNYISFAPRPLERYASQPDCQNLVDPASYSNKDFMPPSFAAGSTLSSTSNIRPEDCHRNGVNKTLQLTSNLYPTHNEGQDESVHPEAQAPTSGGSVESEHIPSVRALASKFDKHTEKPKVKPKPNGLSFTRTRSKSESGSKKPKSVLKSKKNKNNKTPRKSVTFAEDLSNYAAGYESAAELSSFSSSSRANERAYFSDDDDNFPPKAFSDNELDDVEDSSNSDDIPVVREELACHLCHKREIEPGKSYCSKCSFYMSRLVQS